MSLDAWSPSHTILVIFAIVAFIGHVAIMFYRIGQIEKRMEKQGDDFRQALKEQGETFFHALERLEERMDKRFSEMNQRLSETHSEIRDVRTEISKLNQNHIEHLTHHERKTP